MHRLLETIRVLPPASVGAEVVARDRATRIGQFGFIRETVYEYQRSIQHFGIAGDAIFVHWRYGFWSHVLEVNVVYID